MSRPTPKANGPQLRGSDGSLTPLPEQGRLVLGSSAKEVHLLVQGTEVDGVHCCVLKGEGGGWFLQDLGSKGGTLVNGEAIDRVRLWTGDVVRIGNQELVLVDPEHVSNPVKQRVPTSPQKKTAKPARQLAGFKLQRRLGAGGMGEVWLAQQESLDRPVALKLLSPALAQDSAFVKRFQEEARAAAALSHPNVVIVFDVGSADGQHFLAMEFMAGGSLEDQVATQGALPWREAVQAIRDCASGLVFAEERRIVHRDVKPDNLMRSASGSVKLADLGLATSTHGPAADDKILGTPHFLAPEQAKGAAPDHRADLYSLGATAYRLLTAHTPFQGATTRDILRAHQSEQAAPPSQRVPGIPAELDAIVLSLLAKDPDQRPQSAQDLVARLDRLLQAESSSEGEGSRVGLWIAATVVVAAIAAFFLIPRDDADDSLGKPANGNSASAAGNGTSQGKPVVDDTTANTDDGTGDNSFFNPSEGPATIDVEGELERRDLEAQLALASLPPGLPAQRELEELRSIQARYAGTPTAKLLLARIDSIEEQLAQAIEQESSLTAARALAYTTLSRAVGWPPAEAAFWDVGEALRALFATQAKPAQPSTTESEPDATETLDQPLATEDGQEQGREPSAATDTEPDTVPDPAAAQAAPSIREDPAISAARKLIANEIVERALLEVRNLPGQVDLALEEGHFEEAARLIQEGASRLRLPTAPAELVPLGWDELVELARLLHLRADGFGGEVTAKRDAILLEDGRQLAAIVGPGGNLRADLGNNQWDAASQSLDAFLSVPRAPSVHDRAQGFRSLLRSAQNGIVLLVETHAAREWRRQSALLPVAGRDRSVEIKGVDQVNLQALDNNDAVDISWVQILARPKLVQGLFQGRFARPLTGVENRSIIDLLRVSAALRGAVLADQLLDPMNSRVFSEREGLELDGLFEFALTWLSESGSGLDSDSLTTEVVLDVEAARGLRIALDSVQGARWSQAVSQLELLLDGSADSLLIAFLSEATESTSRSTQATSEESER